MPRLRQVDCSATGIRRRGRGRGFEYLDAEGVRIDDPDTLERIRELAIPPAWKDVWICPYPMGHIQATGVDAAGRKQYIYHRRWRELRDIEKFDAMLDFARALPRLRRRVQRDLREPGLTRRSVLACAVRLLDRGFLRIGSEEYTEQNESYGLATLLKEHVRVEGDTLLLDYAAKSGQRRVQAVIDPDAVALVEPLLRRRGGGPELLAYKDGRRWVDVRSGDVNAYVKAGTGGAFSAKDFRTWHATVIAAVALAVSGQAVHSRNARKRAVARAVKEVAYYLGNTPAVCRASYIDPRVIARFEDGVTIGGVLPELANVELGEPATVGKAERAVLDLLEDDRSSRALERVG